MLSNETRLSPPMANARKSIYISTGNAHNISLPNRPPLGSFLPIKLIVRSGQRIILPSRVRFRDNGATPVTAREEMKKGVSGDEVGLRGSKARGVERSRDGESWELPGNKNVGHRRDFQ